MKFRGRTLKYNDDVNTDVIIPSRYLVYTDPIELAKYAMAGLDPEFTCKVKECRLLVAGSNFGCGSSREQAPVALKHSGVECIIAESFARIFYRNAVNIGLPVLACPNISQVVEEGDEMIVDIGKGVVEDLTKGVELKGMPTPSFLLEIMEKGLVQYVREGKK